jgi:hypothetical protein
MTPVLWITNPPRPELVSEDVELDVRIRSSSPRIPAVNDLSLGGMHLQVTLFQACLKLGPDGFRFLLGPDVPASSRDQMCHAEKDSIGSD